MPHCLFIRRRTLKAGEWYSSQTNGSWTWINSRLPMTSSRCGANVNRKERRSLFTLAIIRSYG